MCDSICFYLLNSYDNANRLIQIAQGSSTVSFAYDAASRRTSLALPNGIVMSYSGVYPERSRGDTASQLSGITYTNGGTTLGTLTYAYDLAGRRTQMGGSYAQIGLPLGVSEAEYNANNQLTEWGTASLFYDPNGNMTSDGVNSFNWTGGAAFGAPLNFRVAAPSWVSKGRTVWLSSCCFASSEVSRSRVGEGGNFLAREFLL